MYHAKHRAQPSGTRKGQILMTSPNNIFCSDLHKRSKRSHQNNNPYFIFTHHVHDREEGKENYFFSTCNGVKILVVYKPKWEKMTFQSCRTTKKEHFCALTIC